MPTVLQLQAPSPAPEASVEAVSHLPCLASEKTLVERARRRDFAAFEELVVRHRSRVYSLALHSIQDLRGVEKVLDETFLAAWEELPRSDGGEPFSSWLAKLCGRQIAHQVALFAGSGVVPWPPPATEPRDLPPSGGEPHGTIVATVARLPSMQRAALALSVLGGLTLDDVAGSLGLTLEEVAQHVREAHVLVQQAIDANLGGPALPCAAVRCQR